MKIGPQNAQIVVLVVLLALLAKAFSTVQISEKRFFADFFENTTQIDTYGNHSAYVYLNNASSTQHFINLVNATQFHEKLGMHNYSHELLPKNKSTTLLDLVIIGVCIACFSAIRQGGFMNKHCVSVCSEDDVSMTLADVAGLEHNKKEVLEFVDFIRNRGDYNKIGARMPRGAIFHGPPGTGKTMLAKAVAGECGIPFIFAAGPDFCEMYVGVGAARIRNLFKIARKKAPCIVFIDEIDALGGVRGGVSSGNQERDNTLNRFLIELDGFDNNEGVLIFAATNRLDILDQALLRPGRFDRKIQFDLPERRERVDIFRLYLRNIRLVGNKNKIADTLAKRSLGLSGADISNICNEASILAVRKKRQNVKLSDLEQAVDDVLLGPAKGTFTLSQRDKQTVAYHEAGHTTISYLLKNACNPIKVSIVPRSKGSLGFSQSETQDTKLKRSEEILDQICVLLGGRVAEEIHCAGITTGARDDIEKLTQLAYQYAATYGMDTTVGIIHYDRSLESHSEQFRQNIDDCVRRIINQSYERVKMTLLNNNDLVVSLTKELLEKETLLEDDIRRIFS